MNAKVAEILDTWEKRVASVAQVLGITTEEVILRLNGWGIEQETMGLEMLDDDDVTKFGDFQNVFGSITITGTPEGQHIPLAKLRLAFKFLKGNKKADDRSGVDPRAVELKQRFGIKPTLETASIDQLLAMYDPKKPQDPITVALKKRFGDRKVLVFKSDSSELDVAATVAYINDVEQGIISSVAHVPDSSGTLVELQAVGILVDVVLDEDPLFPGSPLRQHRSIVNHRSWERVLMSNRQLCRIIMERDEIDLQDRDAVLKLIERAEAGPNSLKEVFPEAYIEFSKRSKLDDLPKLKMRPGEQDKKANNPFGIGHVNRKY